MDILDISEDSFDQLFCTVTLSGQEGISTRVYNCLEHVNPDHIRMAVIFDFIDKTVDRYIEADSASEVLG